MKSRGYRVRPFVFTAVLVSLIWAGWARAQQNTPKDPPTGGAVRGSGTANTIPLWTSRSTIGNSSMSQSGSDISVAGAVGTTRSFELPTTLSSHIGVISIGGVPFIHSYSIARPPFVGVNTFVGTAAGNFSMTGSGNTATGAGSLSFNTTGSFNVAMGFQTLFKNSTGENNIAAGYQALQSNTTGSFNAATGTDALDANTTGSYNVATGISALFSNSTGSYNTAIGLLALGSNSIGSGNIAVGNRAGRNLTTGDNNIDIGNDGVASESGVIRIGTAGTNTRTFIAGISTTGVTGVPVVVDASGQLGVLLSSQRFKYDIENMGEASGDLMKLRPVTFRYKQAQEDGSHPLQYGLVAEEVAEIYPDLVVRDKDDQPETIQYYKLDAMLLNEMQKLAGEHAADQAEIRQLRLEIAEQRKQAEERQAIMKQLQAQVGAIQAMLGRGQSNVGK